MHGLSIWNRQIYTASLDPLWRNLSISQLFVRMHLRGHNFADCSDRDQTRSQSHATCRRRSGPRLARDMTENVHAKDTIRSVYVWTAATGFWLRFTFMHGLLLLSACLRDDTTRRLRLRFLPCSKASNGKPLPIWVLRNLPDRSMPCACSFHLLFITKWNR